ncbi:MAG TPA: PIG-L deacetylase family protein [Candidatus Saccharimonadales bacterium]|nr:PIG-L deacetylase family protein [Candidatus Saccharimonadales bacterium]
MNAHTPAPLIPKVVLGVAAHPDDLDYYAGGAMAAFARAGAKVYYLVLTDGGKGSSDRAMTSERLRDMRREEQRRAAKLLGLADVFFCDFPDGSLENSVDVKREIIKTIRQVKPDVVVAFDPSVLYFAPEGLINHPDHRAAGQAALDAVYPLARDHMSFPELLEQGFGPHNTATLLLIGFDAGQANFAVDISDTIDLKFAALGEHASQVSVQQLKEGMAQQAAKAGAKYGYRYAEPFTRIDIG